MYINFYQRGSCFATNLRFPATTYEDANQFGESYEIFTGLHKILPGYLASKTQLKSSIVVSLYNLSLFHSLSFFQYIYIYIYILSINL